MVIILRFLDKDFNICEKAIGCYMSKSDAHNIKKKKCLYITDGYWFNQIHKKTTIKYAKFLDINSIQFESITSKNGINIHEKKKFEEQSV